MRSGRRRRASVGAAWRGLGLWRRRSACSCGLCGVVVWVIEGRDLALLVVEQLVVRVQPCGSDGGRGVGKPEVGEDFVDDVRV